MPYIDIIVGTTVATTTVGSDPGMITLPSHFGHIASVATTAYLEGGGQLLETHVKKYTTNAVRVNRQMVKYNILKLRYSEVGTLLRA